MNKKGNLMLSIAMAVMIFMFGMLVANFLKDDITVFRTAMDCSNMTISDGDKLTCLGGDIVMPYFIFAVFSMAGGILLAKLLL